MSQKYLYNLNLVLTYQLKDQLVEIPTGLHFCNLERLVKYL